MSISTLRSKFITGLASAALALAFIPATAQTMYNNGAAIYIAPGATVHVNGGLETSGVNANLENDGILTIASNPVTSPGTFTMSNGSMTEGDGIYRVEQDWVKAGITTFFPGSSKVELFGSRRQYIKGTNTTFDTLVLTGTGTGDDRKKTMETSALIGPTGMLILNDRELETDVFFMSVINDAVNSVSNSQVPGSEGFVSSITPGGFGRITTGNAPYFFPVGSSVNVTRYRPLELTPNSGNDTYMVRFVNHDANVEGYSRSLLDSVTCTANDAFYHDIWRTTGGSGADIKLYFIPSVDGPWTGMAHWRLLTAWEDMGLPAKGTAGIFTTLSRPWDFVNTGTPFILTELKPYAEISCPSSLCAHSGANVITAGGLASSYTWSVPADASIESGQGTDSVMVDWGSTPGYVYVVANSQNCSSLPDSCFITLLPDPEAGFTATSAGPYNNLWAFTDTSNGAASWSWSFGDGNASSLQNPNHHFATSGNYDVMQVVTNSFGCVDSALMLLSVEEGVLIPNVFTPDGDGINDQFYIQSSGFDEYKIQIFNRWGVKLFESSASEIKWDGRTTAGIKVPDGTYFFILDAASPVRSYHHTGFIMVLGSSSE